MLQTYDSCFFPFSSTNTPPPSLRRRPLPPLSSFAGRMTVSLSSTQSCGVHSPSNNDGGGAYRDWEMRLNESSGWLSVAWLPPLLWMPLMRLFARRPCRASFSLLFSLLSSPDRLYFLYAQIYLYIFYFTTPNGLKSINTPLCVVRASV